MTDTPNEGETVVPKNDATVTPPAPTPTGDDSVEKLKQQLEEERRAREQAEMRKNQLENEKKARDEAESERKARELEEQNQYKELFEQEKAKREALEAEEEEKARKEEINSTQTTVLGEFSEEVRELAKDAGISLSSTEATEVEAFKEKLTKISDRLTKTGAITPNNPAPKTEKIDLNQDELRETLQSEEAFHDLVTKKFPGIAAMTTPKQ